ncbi:MAG: 3-oxoacyl-ACP reductase, partial [Solirubrobacteraceae bacterium]
MSDLYARAVSLPPGSLIASRLGLPRPARLARYRPGAPLIAGEVLLGWARDGRLHDSVRRVLDGAGVRVAQAGRGGQAGRDG